jgi:hypothetical protein
MSDTNAEPTKISSSDYYEVIRRRIEHEDNLIVQRLSWLVGSQSFLYTAYAIVLNGLTVAPVPATARFVEQQLLLFRLLPLVAIITCALICIGILAAVKAMAELRTAYQVKIGNDTEHLPEIQVRSQVRRLGLSAPVLLPLIFIAVWLLLWIRG